MSSRPGLALVVVATALALFALPFADILNGVRPDEIYNTLAADTYYYAAMARNFTTRGFFGVDGETVSNGYMPLWQMIVAGLDTVFAGPGSPPEALLRAIFLTAALLTATGILLIVVFAMRRIGSARMLLLLPLLVPGAAFFVFEHAYRQFPAIGLHNGTGLWSQANGMESGVCLLAFGAFLWPAARTLDPERATRASAALAGALAFLVMMGRLDDVFLGIAFGLCLLPQAAAQGRPRLIVAMAIVPLLGTAFYLWVNATTAGTPLPTSGMLKTQLFSFPTRAEFLAEIGRVQAYDWRLLPVLGALVTGVLGLLSQRGLPWSDPGASLVRMLSLYLILKGGFLFSSVPIVEQGYWYYTNMLAAMNLLILFAVARAVPADLPGPALAIGTVGTLAIALLAGLNAQEQLTRYRDYDYVYVSRDLCTAPERVARLLPEDAKIIDTGDGVYAFCLGRPAVTMTGLADSAAFNARRNELGFFAAALEKGHDILIASPVTWASYDWQAELGSGYRPVLVGEDLQVQVWRIEPR